MAVTDASRKGRVTFVACKWPLLHAGYSVSAVRGSWVWKQTCRGTVERKDQHSMWHSLPKALFLNRWRSALFTARCCWLLASREIAQDDKMYSSLPTMCMNVCVCVCVCVCTLSPSLVAAKFMLTYFSLRAAAALSTLIYITRKLTLVVLDNMCSNSIIEMFVIKYTKAVFHFKGRVT